MIKGILSLVCFVVITILYSCRNFTDYTTPDFPFVVLSPRHRGLPDLVGPSEGESAKTRLIVACPTSDTDLVQSIYRQSVDTPEKDSCSYLSCGSKSIASDCNSEVSRLV